MTNTRRTSPNRAEHDFSKAWSLEKEEKRTFFQEFGNELKVIIIGVVVFAAGILLEKLAGQRVPAAILFLAAYVILGIWVYRRAFLHIRKKEIFNENILIILASIGAIIIGEYLQAAAVIVFYRICMLIEDIAVERSQMQISEALDLRPETAVLVESGQLREVPAEEVKEGECIRIEPGCRIPLDGIVEEGESQIDTSPMTGEPLPAAARKGDEVLSGCVNLSDPICIRVTRPLSESMVTRVMKSVENAAANKPRMERRSARFVKIYTPAVAAAAVLVFLIPTLRGGDWHYWLRTACTFLVISCPCAIAISVPLAYITGLAAASKNGMLFKSGESLEAVTNARVVVMDKTGTLTDGVFGLQSVIPEEGFAEEIGGDGDSEYESAEDIILRLCAGAERGSKHPLAQSVLRAAEVWKLEPDIPTETEELAGKGIRAILPEGEVLCGSQTFLRERGVAFDAEYLKAYGSEIYVALNGRYLGRLLLADRLKEGADALINEIHHMQSKTAILTGDKRVNAEAVARNLGIKMVYAELMPDAKLDVMKRLRKDLGSVMYVGDGINDAPVMAGADVSAAMGSGADLALDTADIVYLHPDLETVKESIVLAYQTVRIAGENIFLAMLIKLGMVFLGMVGYADISLAIVADTIVAVICIFNSVRVLFTGKYRINREQDKKNE
ncbi:MAG: heavy metal translocating P-type ATPase [Eubacterium sp.]|nr:heavy metal translocating P-type ATPase [Eubacterium sp.]